MSNGSRVVCYARDSGGREQALSVDQQLERIGTWCREHGHILTRQFTDRARSGTTTTGRDAFRDMMDYLSNGAAETGVVLWEFSRLARDYDDAQYYVADLRRRGIEVFSITDNIPEGLDGRLLESILAWKNARYSEDMGRNISRGLRYMVAHHKGFAGSIPVGYLGDPVEVGKRRDGTPHIIKRLIPDPDKAPLVRLAFEMRADGATLRDIHEQTRLYTWMLMYSYMLRNRIYTGVYRYGGVDYPDFCKPLVDQDTWDRAQTVNDARRKRQGSDHPRAVHSDYFLTGLARCRICDSPMHGHTTPGKHTSLRYYVCGSITRVRCGARMIPAGELEALVLQVVSDVVLTPGVIGELQTEVTRQSNAAGDTERERQSRLSRENTELASRISRLIAAITAAGHSRALIDELTALEARQAQIAVEMARQAPRPVKLPPIDYDVARKALYSATPSERGIILRGFVQWVSAVRENGIIQGEIQYSVGDATGRVSL